MFYVMAAGLVLLNVVWMGVTLLGLPGNWLMILGAVVMTWIYWKSGVGWGGQVFSLYSLLVLVGLGVLGEVLEFILGAVGAKKAGGGMWSAGLSILTGIIGGILGTGLIPVPVVGTLVGASAGAFAGAWAGEMMVGKKMGEALAVGKGAAVGRLLGTVAKSAVGAVIFLWIAVAVFV